MRLGYLTGCQVARPLLRHHTHFLEVFVEVVTGRHTDVQIAERPLDRCSPSMPICFPIRVATVWRKSCCVHRALVAHSSRHIRAQRTAFRYARSLPLAHSRYILIAADVEDAAGGSVKQLRPGKQCPGESATRGTRSTDGCERGPGTAGSSCRYREPYNARHSCTRWHVMIRRNLIRRAAGT
jgi:hypothetical protein